MFCGTKLNSEFITHPLLLIVLSWHCCIATVTFYIAFGSKTMCAAIASLTPLFQVPTQIAVAIPSKAQVSALFWLLKFLSYSKFDTAILSVSLE